MQLVSGIRNCHAFGVNSVVLQERPCQRVFIATNDHDLWRNAIGQEFSVGFHPHHCDIRLTCLSGTVWNVDAVKLVSPEMPADVYFREWRFNSPILGKQGNFEPTGHRFNLRVFTRRLHASETIFLRAHYLHTIYVPRGFAAEWLVEELTEDRLFIPLCYGNADLSAWTPEGLYLPMDEEETAAHVVRAKSIIACHERNRCELSDEGQAQIREANEREKLRG